MTPAFKTGNNYTTNSKVVRDGGIKWWQLRSYTDNNVDVRVYKFFAPQDIKD